jgi:L-threonylcarbamoyladenylate synthase
MATKPNRRSHTLDATSGEALNAAVAALRAGHLVAMPTETVYGLAGDATNPRAVAAIYQAKGRPRFNPLIVHVASLDEARRVAVMSPGAERLAKAFWPGPLTLVLPRRTDSGIADLATAGLATVAVRVPAHPVARDLIAAFGRPLTAPSANRSGHVSATTAAHVAADLGDAVAIILDAGASRIGMESTIVALDGHNPVLLRAGGIPRAVIEAAVGAELAAPPVGDPEAPQAPGMLASHYAPVAAIRLDAVSAGPEEAFLAFGPVPPAALGALTVLNLSARGDLVEAAANFFAALRTLDARAKKIAVAPIPDEGLGEAINDRLKRAAAPRG